MKKILIAVLLFALILPVFGQNQDEFKFSLVPRRVAGGTALPANAPGYLLNDGSGGLSWAAVSLSGYLKADGTIPLTADWPMGAFNLSQATWQGVAIAPAYGGTGLASYTVGDILHATGTTTIGKLSDVAVGQVLTSGGVGVVPAYSANPSVTSLVLTGTGTLASTAGNATFTTSLTAAAGNETAFSLNYTTNKLAGNDTGLIINQTDTASPGASLLFDAQVGGVSKIKGDNAGSLYCTYLQSVTGIITQTSNVTLKIQDSNRTYSGTGSTNGVEIGGGANTRTAGTFSATAIIPVYNQTSGTAANTDLLISRTETAIGSGKQRFISGDVGGVELWGIDNRGGQMAGMIPDAIMQVGMIAMVDAGTDGRYDINGVNNEAPIGIVGGSEPTAAGTARGLAVSGIAYVAPAEDVISVTRGYIAFQDATDAGYADFAANVAAARHDYEIGHPIVSEAAVAFDGAVDVDPVANTIVLDSTPAWVVGDPVIFWNSGDTEPTGMTDGAVYWIKTIATATVTLTAIRGGAVLDITADGSGTTMYLMRLPKCLIHWN